MWTHRGSWSPIVAEREAATIENPVAFPCRGEYNRYLGCIGARRCRAAGVSTCILGRWPDERQANTNSTEPEPVAARPPRRAAVAIERTRTASPTRQAARAATPPESPEPARDRAIIGIVQPEQRLWQQLSRQVASAGFQPVWLPTDSAANEALAGAEPPAALLVAGNLVAPANQSEPAVITAASQREVPVLRLPAVRDQATLASAARMAVLWLTVTLRCTA